MQRDHWRDALANYEGGAILTDTAGKICYLNPPAESLCNTRSEEVLGKPLPELLAQCSGDGNAALPNAQLAAILESSDDVILSKTLDGVITSWNQGAEKVLGYTADEVIGQHVSMFVPADVNDIEYMREKIRRGEKVDHYTTKRRRKDGKIVDILLTVSPIRNASGEITGDFTVGRDVTESRQAFLLKDWLAAIVESSDDIIVSKNLEGVITSWNTGAERIFGYTAEEVVGKDISLLIPEDHAEDVHLILGMVRRGEKVEHYETKRRCKDGKIIDVSLTVSPIRDAEGRIVGASKIGRDITQQKLIEAERRDVERRKDEFLAMLAHELRNPLASISSTAQLLGKLETEEELEWAKEVINRQVKHLSRLIDDLLDVSRINRGKISLRKEPVDLAPIISTAIEAVRPLIEQRKHELSVSLAPGLRVHGDVVRLEQILINLLANAAKYTEPGGRISVTAASDGDWITLKVSDTGMGITPELLPKVFDLFVQGDRSMARSEGGLGIGLTLVQRLIQLHGGMVTAASEGPDQGSTFTVRLPALQSAPAPRADGTTELPRMARRSSRILVVDDNADTAAGLTKLLQLLGHDVKMAHDGAAAIEVARGQNPEVVLLDIGLPRMNGYEVVRQLRQEPCCKTAMIIAISGYGQEEDRRKSKEAGFDHHLVKPIDFDALMSLLA